MAYSNIIFRENKFKDGFIIVLWGLVTCNEIYSLYQELLHKLNTPGIEPGMIAHGNVPTNAHYYLSELWPIDTIAKDLIIDPERLTIVPQSWLNNVVTVHSIKHNFDNDVYETFFTTVLKLLTKENNNE